MLQLVHEIPEPKHSVPARQQGRHNARRYTILRGHKVRVQRDSCVRNDDRCDGDDDGKYEAQGLIART